MAVRCATGDEIVAVGVAVTESTWQSIEPVQERGVPIPEREQARPGLWWEPSGGDQRMLPRLGAGEDRPATRALGLLEAHAEVAIVQPGVVGERCHGGRVLGGRVTERGDVR